jgi:hypothetical protein
MNWRRRTIAAVFITPVLVLGLAWLRDKVSKASNAHRWFEAILGGKIEAAKTKLTSLSIWPKKDEFIKIDDAESMEYLHSALMSADSAFGIDYSAFSFAYDAQLSAVDVATVSIGLRVNSQRDQLIVSYMRDSWNSEPHDFKVILRPKTPEKLRLTLQRLQ